jgi:Uma2 family endonuclease
MERKLKDYFFAGVRLVWLIDPAKRAAEAYAAPDACETLGEGDALDGGAVLPGFTLPLRQLFARVGPQPAPKRARRKKGA